jgi:superfamily II DNA/RNA helicase
MLRANMPNSICSFQEAQLSDTIMEVIQKARWVELIQIQKASLPIILSGMI